MLLIIGLICGAICAIIASSKERSAIGWFLMGFVFGILGLIICLCMSNLKDQRMKEEAMQREQVRLNERLKQEKVKNRKFQSHVRSRLDAHDNELQIDTRDSSQLESGGRRQPLAAATRDTLNAADDQGWYFELSGERQGPVTKTVIDQLFQTGTITLETLLYHEALNEWKPASHVMEEA
jgi:hypothetical protein